MILCLYAAEQPDILAIAEEMRGLIPDSKIKFVGCGREPEKTAPEAAKK